MVIDDSDVVYIRSNDYLDNQEIKKFLIDIVNYYNKDLDITEVSETDKVCDAYTKVYNYD